jgi:CHASE3 domain sensor protein
MNKYEIIEMARQAGMYQDLNVSWNQSIQNFAKLVEDKVRQEIIEKNAPVIKKVNEHIKELQDAVAKEREECAKICDAINAVYTKPEDAAERVASQWCAERIRARGEQT